MSNNPPSENEAEILQALEKVERTREWLGKHQNEVRAKYQGKVFAIEDEEIIDSSDDVNDLIQKVKNKGKDTAFLVIEAIPPKGVAYIL